MALLVFHRALLTIRISVLALSTTLIEGAVWNHPALADIVTIVLDRF
jgi:hypothetical protein